LISKATDAIAVRFPGGRPLRRRREIVLIYARQRLRGDRPHIIAAYLALWKSVETNKVVGALCPNDLDGNAWADAKFGFPPALQRSF
jgi:hypothetical protein